MLIKPSTLSSHEESLARTIVASAFAVHRGLGPGLLESVYEVCFCHELTKHGLTYQRQLTVPIVYDGLTFKEGLRLDVLVEGLVVCELKSAEAMHAVFRAQLLTQLKLTGKRLGFLINFGMPLIKDGLERIVR
jgi:GxxExxY protein